MNDCVGKQDLTKDICLDLKEGYCTWNRTT